MKLFDNNPQSKAMQSLIHDTRNCGDTIRLHIKKLQERLKELAAADTKAFVHMEYIRSNTTNIEKAIDAYYESFSNDFPEHEAATFHPEIVTAYNLAEQFLPDGDWKGDKLTIYKAFDLLMESYTLIRKPSNQQNVQGSDTTESPSSTKADNQNSLKEAEIEELAEKILVKHGGGLAYHYQLLVILAAMKEMYYTALKTIKP